MSNIPTIYIGYDKKEDRAYKVLCDSILSTTSKPVNIIPLVQSSLRHMGLYRRSWKRDKENNIIDTIDTKPFSTEFSFTRFLVPFLNLYQGLALYMDCDMLVRSDIMEVFDSVYRSNISTAMWCVKHHYIPEQKVKMDDRIQTQYSRKNWSSFVLWDCAHEAHRNLTIDDINTKPGLWLHNFRWLADLPFSPMEGPYSAETKHISYHSELIGTIPEEWNWLDGHSPEQLPPKNVHFTTGGPWYPKWNAQRVKDASYAAEWEQYNSLLEMDEMLGRENTIKWKKLNDA